MDPAESNINRKAFIKWRGAEILGKITIAPLPSDLWKMTIQKFNGPLGVDTLFLQRAFANLCMM